MTHVLQAVAALLLLALGAYLVPLLIQLRRTSAALEELAKSTSRDISRVADDIHQIRQQVEEIGALAKETLVVPAQVGRMVSAFTQNVPSLFRTTGPKPGLWEILMEGAQAAMTLFRRPRADRPQKEEPYE